MQSRFGRLGLALTMLLTAKAAQATTYYTATTGSDSTSCVQAQSTGTPKRSINAGVACLAAGDTLLVRAGTYAESLVNPSLASGTSWANPIRVAAYTSETVWMKPPAGPLYAVYLVSQSYIEFTGINLDLTNGNDSNHMGGFNVNWNSDSDYAHHIRYQNAEILGNRIAGDLLTSRQLVNIAATPSGFGGSNEVLNVVIHGSGGSNATYGFYIHGSNNIVDGCDIYDVGYLGIQVYNGDGPGPNGNIIRNNTIHDIVTGMAANRVGILFAGDNTLVYNNVIYNINSSGTYSAGTQSAISGYVGSGNGIYNNTIANNHAIAIDLSQVSSTLVRNNISYSNSADYNDSGSGNSQDHNLFGTNPTFVNAGAADFHLQASSTAAIDTGVTIAAVISDKDGVARPKGSAYDIGAYEYCTSGCGSITLPTPPAPTNLRISATAANAETNAVCTLLNGGFFDLYTATQPATADTAPSTQTKLASLPLSNPACGSASGGVATLNAITADTDADATGIAAWFRAWISDHTTTVFDGRVETSAADLNLSHTFIAAHQSVAITGFTIASSLSGGSPSGNHNPKLTNLAANAKADALCALLNNGFLDIYTATQPATADTAISTQTRVASLRFNATACGGAVAGVATANTITSDTDADATGTAAWFRAWKSDHTTAIMDGSVGDTSGDVRLTTTAITLHDTVSVATFTITASKG